MLRKTWQIYEPENKDPYYYRSSKNYFMGMVRANVVLSNILDMEDAKRQRIAADEIRSLPVQMLVDSGSYKLCINEAVQEVLQLPEIGRRLGQIATGKTVYFPEVGPVHLKFENRTVICTALVLPGTAECLLGAIPIEEMDVLIDPLNEKLIVNPAHPNYAVLRV